MECIIDRVETSAGDVIVHTLVYPSRSVIVWILSSRGASLDDLHIASPDKYSKLPALSSRMGDTESRGRGLALRISKKFGIQCIVSWCLGDEGAVGGEIVKSVENKVFDTIQSLEAKKVRTTDPLVGIA